MAFDPANYFGFLLGGAEAAKLPLALLLVFGGAKLLNEIFEYFKQPGIIGEILAGVLIGPTVLNWVQPNEVLTALAELGAMFLLFRVGLEVKVSELMKVGRTALIVAILGVVLPFMAGWGIMRLWGEPSVESIFVGAAMVATSVGITAQVLSAKGLLSHRASQIILAAAIIDDVLGLLVLAVVSGLAKGAVNFADLGMTIFIALTFTVVVAHFGARIAKRVVPILGGTLNAAEAQFNLALVHLFGLALLAVYAGVAAIIGAFLAGMAVGESVEHRVHDLSQGITEFLTPFFLAGIGLHLDLQALNSADTMLLAAVLVIAAVFSKMVGCGLGAWSLGKADMLRIGAGMVPRGEVGMVVAQLGLTLGVISGPIYGVVVVMAIATTMVAPPLLNLTYRDVTRGVPVEQFDVG
jgi:Kef-type K+ transport system membrane component KefB